jgi:hypothetical protein
MDDFEIFNLSFKSNFQCSEARNGLSRERGRNLRPNLLKIAIGPTCIRSDSSFATYVGVTKLKEEITCFVFVIRPVFQDDRS